MRVVGQRVLQEVGSGQLLPIGEEEEFAGGGAVHQLGQLDGQGLAFLVRHRAHPGPSGAVEQGIPVVGRLGGRPTGGLGLPVGQAGLRPLAPDLHEDQVVRLDYFRVRVLFRAIVLKRFDDLTSRRTEVEQSYKKYEEKLGRIDHEVQAILDGAKAQGEIEKQKIIDDATRAAADIKRKAELSVQFEFAQAKQALLEEVAEQASSMAASLVQKNFTEADQSKLVTEFLDKVGARA